MRFTAFKAKGRELLCTKFRVSKAVDVDKTRVLFNMHPQRSFFRRNVLYISAESAALKAFLRGRKPGEKPEQSRK